jgi:hypothetical protein
VEGCPKYAGPVGAERTGRAKEGQGGQDGQDGQGGQDGQDGQVATVHEGTGVALEGEGLVARVPPAMDRAAGNRGRLPGPDRQPAPVDHGGQRPGEEAPLFVLCEVNVQRWALAVWGERPLQHKAPLAVQDDPSQGESLAGVAVLQDKF